MRKIGVIKKKVISLLKLNHIKENSPVFIGEQNIAHMKSRHPAEFDMYFNDIEMIIDSPDYIGINSKDGSITYVKLYEANNEYIRVGVKVSVTGKFFARTLHLLSTCNAENYIQKGTLISVNNTE